MFRKNLASLTLAVLAVALTMWCLPAWGQRRMAMAGAGGPPSGATGKGDLHLPQGKQVNFNVQLRDGGGYQWDLQYYLSVGQGTNYIYSGGLYCQINNNNVCAPNSQGWMGPDGDEVEIGPYNSGNCQVYRRCKVYKDQAMARWLDIFVNNTSSPVTLPVRIYSCMNNSISRTVSSSGGASFTDKDFAFITDHGSGDGSGRPNLLHIVCGLKTKLRPTVQPNSNQLYVNYNLVVPANSTSVLCYFESQGHTMDELQKRMKDFKPSAMLKDLNAATKKLIVNFGPMGEIEGVELDRSGTADAVMLKDGDHLNGTIVNDKFTLEAFYGTLELPADKIIGFVGVPDQEDKVRVVLAGGQVLTGKLKEDKLKLTLPTMAAGDDPLLIPFSRIKQCSYQISKTKPEDSPMTDPLMFLRTGDRLAFDPTQLHCTFQTRHGTVELNGKDLLEVRLNQEEHGVHRAFFTNGSTLAGLLGPEKIALPVKLGPKLDISRDMVLSIKFTEDEKDGPSPAHAVLSNDDELFGKLADDVLRLSSEFREKEITVVPANIVSITFDKKDPRSVKIVLWDGTDLSGKLQQDAIKFQVTPGPLLELSLGHIVSLDCSDALPDEETVKKVAKCIAMLSAAGYKDREEAQEALINMKGKILPLLKKHYTEATDPEVHQRIRTIIDKLGGSLPDATPPPQPMLEIGFQGGLKCCG
jgi:hypothetical protein